MNNQLQSLTGAVVAETDRQKEFPRYAEKKLARLELEAANGFNDVRAKGQEFVKSLTDQYLEKAKLLSTTADEEIADKEAQYPSFLHASPHVIESTTIFLRFQQDITAVIGDGHAFFIKIENFSGK